MLHFVWCAPDGLAMMFICIGLIVLPVIVALYRWVNGKKDKELGGKNYTAEELLQMGDRAPSFQYML